MKVHALLCLFIYGLFYSSASLAQYNISGKVIDAESKLPLEGASVFAQNTTSGTITNNEGNFILRLTRGGYQLVVSYTGYESKQINIEANADKSLDIELQKEDKSLSEVVVISSNEVTDGWDKYGELFINHFIGTSPNAAQTKIQNPQAVKFYYYKRSDRLKVLATEPLQITNNALGYNLRYELDSFVYHFKTDMNSYRGNCLYQAMQADFEQQKKWEENRQKTYYGSRLHFLRSYYDSTLKEEGFTVDMLTSSQQRKFSRLANPYHSKYYHVNDSTDDVELSFPQKASITYIKAPPEEKYLQHHKLPLDVKTQISYVDMVQPIILKENGYFIDQKYWINQGYWSWKNVADQLPYDYLPPDSE